MSAIPSYKSGFPTTHWAEIRRLQDMPVEERRAALGEFLERYTPAMLSYVRYFFGDLLGNQDAEQLVHDFTVDRILVYDLIAKVTARRGRLRSLLKVALKNYCKTQISAANSRLKPSSQRIDAVAVEAEASFEQSWAENVAAEAAMRVEERFLSRGRRDYLRLLQVRVLDPARGNENLVTSRELAKELGCTEQVMRSKLAKAKREFVEALREVVAEYAECCRGVDEELASLMRGLTHPGLKDDVHNTRPA